MADRYPTFSALASTEAPSAYAITLRDINSRVVIAAPHGGGIEGGTSEIALAIAGQDYSYYLFEGKKSGGNKDLHITSCNFDEPQALVLLTAADLVVTVHGESSNTDVVYLGGLNSVVMGLLRASLEKNGFAVTEHKNPELQGRHPRNICNIGKNGAGVQLELSRGLRLSFFESLSQDGRKRPSSRLWNFSALIRSALLEYQR